LLEEAVAELRGGDGVAPLDVRVDLQVPAYLPDDYVGDAEQKMGLYRRLARLRDPGVWDHLREELRDRYGAPPEPVENLIALHEIRLLAGRNGVEEIRAGRRALDLFFASAREPSPTIIRGLMAMGPQGLEFKAVDQFIMRIPVAREQRIAAARAAVGLLERLRQAQAA
jgi:transcription-repair coupling factor (superfamily II helicase)